MTFHQDKEAQTIVLEDVQPYFVQLLRKIPECADPGDDPAARARIYSSPMQKARDKQFEEDWREFVQPELVYLFQSARDTVTGDLAMLPPPEKKEEAETVSTLAIPTAHAEAWLSTLNQARLVLGTKHRFNEKEMVADVAVEPRSEHDCALLQMRFYDSLQSLFLKVMGYG